MRIHLFSKTQSKIDFRKIGVYCLLVALGYISGLRTGTYIYQARIDHIHEAVKVLESQIDSLYDELIQAREENHFLRFAEKIK